MQKLKERQERMADKVLTYKKVESLDILFDDQKSVTYDKNHKNFKEKGGRVQFHEIFYSLDEVKDVITMIEGE